ncbi:hypothetical protein C5B85_07040 [Pseudoclavibacter sp. AY1F1]|uniref:hypothetical protein n=1 Tax=Pseudoclavibacter sp. AY1F1 TaxID=2080583 RepID=UPI000CE819E1|nr:hypothetical protein [Pseudoclavibacter sp. AY1F1]PPF45330.1 hypothetical protein C5B85_07040 [Pseudoclavibacter sp. AY1F1]
MTNSRLAHASILGAALLLLVGCADANQASPPDSTASATPVESSSVVATDETPSQTSIEGIPVEEMVDQPVSVQLTQCLTQNAQWIDLPEGKGSPDLHTRVAASEQELLFLLPQELGGFDNAEVSDNAGPSARVTVFVVGSADSGDDAAAQWQSMRDASPEVDAAAARIEAEGASFTPQLVEFSYADLCSTQLSAFAMPMWTSSDSGLQSVRMDVEANRLIAVVVSGVITSADIDEIVATGPAGIYDFEEVQ